jgi:hypothetical protein
LYDRVEQADRKIESLIVPSEKSRSKIARGIAEARTAYEQRVREEIVRKIGDPSKRRRS